MKQIYEIHNKIKWVSTTLTELCEGLENNQYKSRKKIISLSSKVEEIIWQTQQDIVDHSSQFNQFQYCFIDLERRFSTVEEILLKIKGQAKSAEDFAKSKEEITFSAGAALVIWDNKCLDEYEGWLQSFLEQALDYAIKTQDPQFGSDIIQCAKKLDFDNEELLKKHDEFVIKISQSPLSLLKHYREKLNTHKLVSLIGEKLSPTISYLYPLPVEYPKKSVPLTHSETYVRSEKHSRVQSLGQNALILYKDKKLKNGEPAHAGSYGNLMQMLGDTFKPIERHMHTSYGDASLYHSLLLYKNKTCAYIVDKMKLNDPPRLLKVGFYNEYPCVMVWIDPRGICKSDNTKSPSTAAQEEWVNFLMSYFVGLLNFNAYKAKIPIEMQRRSSFGFMTPTIAPTSGSFRINIGVIPKMYADLVVSSLQQLDGLLANLPSQFMPISKDIFYGSEAHKKYLAEVAPKKIDVNKEVNKKEKAKPKIKKVYKPVVLNSLLHVLWAQIEKRGKTTVQNVVRTAYARDGISAEVLKQLIGDETHAEAFASALEWAIGKIYIKKQGERTSVSVKTEVKLNSIIQFSDLKFKIKDDPFWIMINDIIQHFLNLKNPRLSNNLEALKLCCQTQVLNEVYSLLDTLNQLVFVSAIDNVKIEENGDGYGSDSDTEEEVTLKVKRSQPVNVKLANPISKIAKDMLAHDNIKDEVKEVNIFSKKIITHNGMRAIWGAILTVSQYLKEENIKDNAVCRLFLDNTYYEVPLGLKIINQLHNERSIDQVKTLSEANLMLYDINACITNGKPNTPLNPKTIGNKILILDATSATSEQINPYLLNFAQSRASMLFVVDSGFKNQQAGADVNQYGTVRIFTRDKKMLENIYNKIKTIEPPLLSPTSHALRRLYKAADLVPVTKKLFRP